MKIYSQGLQPDGHVYLLLRQRRRCFHFSLSYLFTYSVTDYFIKLVARQSHTEH